MYWYLGSCDDPVSAQGLKNYKSETGGCDSDKLAVGSDDGRSESNNKV